MLTEGGVPAHLIDVNTRDGIVTLSGWVDNLLAKERAGEIAESVKGVRAVVNRIAITTVRPDGEILTDVRAAFQADPATDSYEISTIVKDGVVTLFGTVDSWPERWLSARVATGVRGVKAVTNELTVEPQAKPPITRSPPISGGAWPQTSGWTSGRSMSPSKKAK
ncbi:MAG TPA: BON domain-containing protein [Candidatus Tectomicrobia bacterium]|nr:BON domain-containing protein [Candidatus Tectomicrobia bacterium]